MELSKEYIEQIKKQMEKFEWYENLRHEAEVLNRTRRQELVDLVNSILSEEHCPPITVSQIKFYPQYIGNTGIGLPIDKGLTKIIYNYYYPPAPNGEYAHFTDLSALESILTFKKIRLTSTIKRKNELEFKLFYEDHDIDGFKRPADASTQDEQLMNDLFYLSLTENRESLIDIKRGMWKYFGKGGTGVKLIFDISTVHSDFRKVYYPDSPFSTDKKLMIKLMERINATFGKPFLFNSISKFGAFYIHSDFDDECETRYLIKRHSDDYPFSFSIQHQGTIPFIELDFVSPWGSFLPIKVQPGLNCNRAAVQSIVDASGLTLEVLPSATSL
jgi:hypothetical protein